jgi:hypothetical protein
LSTVSLREAASKIAPKTPGPACGFGKILDQLSQDDRAWIDEQFSLGRTFVYVADVLTADGRKVSDFMVARHRKGRCNCVAS